MKKRSLKDFGKKPKPVTKPVSTKSQGPKPLGRPKFAVTKATRNYVEELISMKMSQQDIARAIGCTVPTLVLHFKEELEEGAARKRGEMIKILYDLARKGNVSAVRKAISMNGGDVDDENAKFSSTKYEEDFDIKDRPQHNKRYAKKLGKKDQRQKEAEEISGEDAFAAPSPPKLVVDNVKKVK